MDEQSTGILSSQWSKRDIFHVDNGAQLTWISILEGRKIWYFPRKITSESVRLLALAGSQWPQGYEEGWARVELCPGDLLYVHSILIHQKILLI